MNRAVALKIVLALVGLLFLGLFRLFSGFRGEVQPAAVEVDRVDEVAAAESSSTCATAPSFSVR